MYAHPCNDYLSVFDGSSAQKDTQSTDETSLENTKEQNYELKCSQHFEKSDKDGGTLGPHVVRMHKNLCG